MKNRILICLSALVICVIIIFLNISDLPKYQQNEFPSASPTQKLNEEGKININTATAEELTALYGIGEVRAKEIIRYREENGKILSAEELQAIDGINQSVIDKNSDIITF